MRPTLLMLLSGVGPALSLVGCSADGAGAGGVSGPGGDSGAECPVPPWSSDVSPGSALPTGLAGGGGDPERAALLADEIVQQDGVVGAFWPTGDGAALLRTPLGDAVLSRDAGGVAVWSTALMRDDPLAAESLAEELSGENPESTSYPDHGYDEGDPRVSFPSDDAASFPFSAARVAAILDARTAPDLGVIRAPYARGGLGSHGGLAVAQSRAPLIVSGPGVVRGAVPGAAQVVDVAPTVLALLGGQPVSGVDGARWQQRDGLMLAWQDGRVLSELLDGDCAWGAADHVVVFILDGMSHTELLDAVDNGRAPNIAALAGSGAWMQAGSIVGWPSYSLPGHLSVHTGAWPGHHGLISNRFYDRATGGWAPDDSLDTLLVDSAAARDVMDAWLSPDVETVFEAVRRSFPDDEVASINELTFRGATFCRLCEQRRSAPPPADLSRYELADDSALLQVDQLLEGGVPKFAAISLYSTDAAGESGGPHGDLLRDTLGDTDARIGDVVDAWRDAGAYARTVFVITADHGMELQDSARVSTWTAPMGDGVEASGGLVYFAGP